MKVNQALEHFARLGRWTIASLARLGRGSMFFLMVLSGLGDVVRKPTLLLRQMWSVGVQTLLIILVAGLFVGMVLGLQGYNTLVDFGAEE
ncbi:MAG: ABC transporter permease, partial [Gammaproteobacteria bacterium]|nr:ABC transporter permease [Gammaproteobacteria bacterium]